MSTTSTSDAVAADRVHELEAELEALRENSARAHRELHEDLSAQLATLTAAYETLHRNHTQLRMNFELERRQRRKHRQRVNRLRADLARVRRERNAALAALKRSPSKRGIALARKILARARKAARSA